MQDGITRKQALQRGAAGAAALGVTGVLAACGDDDEGGGSTGAGTGTGAEAAELKQGGELRVGGAGGGSGDTLDANSYVSAIDQLRLTALYDALVEIDGKFELQMRLAESVEPNADATEWTVTLREGVEFHDGRPVTSEDVMFTLRRILDPDTKALGRGRLKMVNADKSKAVDERTIKLVLDSPNSILDWALAGTANGIIPTDWDVSKPIGAGAFKYVSFSPGQESVFERNESYYREPAHLDALRVINLTDEAARINALTSGQVDAINDVPAGRVAELEGNSAVKVLRSPAGSWYPFVMRVDAAPFDDVRVRQALRLCVDREQMIKVALGGYGTPGSDLYGRWDTCYPTSLERTRDVEQARALLKEAGKTTLDVELVTSDFGGGLIAASQVLVENAKEIGVNIKLRKLDNSSFNANVLNWPFAVQYWPAQPYLFSASSSDGPNASFNETHFDNAEFNKLYLEALSITDAGQRCGIIEQMAKIQFDEGGYIIPYFPDVLSAHSTKVSGFLPDDRRGAGLGANRFETVGFVA